MEIRLSAQDGHLVIDGGPVGATLTPGDLVGVRLGHLRVTVTVEEAPVPWAPTDGCDCEACVKG